jgi:hypothetical protein
MANLRNLLIQRAAQTDVPIRDGRMFLFHANGASGGTRNFCWVSPGTGTAIIEVWGAGGGGGHCMCCTFGISGNSGAYSRTTIPVTSASFVCGQVGGSQNASNTFGCGCIGCCSHVGIAPAGTVTRCVAAQGGSPGFQFPGGSGIASYCYALCCGFFGSNPCGYGAGCGIVCNFGVHGLTGLNWGGFGCTVAACACGGDLNVSGGISAVDFLTCDVSSNPTLINHIVAIPAGLRSLVPECICVNMCDGIGPPGSITLPGTVVFEINYSRAMQGLGRPSRYVNDTGGVYCDNYCCCTPYQNVGIVGAGYLPTMANSGITTGCGARGGPGLVKITFI